jgi:vacuolar-type H+-ATPase subunit E/Vma4
VKEEKERKKIFEEIEENRLILMKKKEILDAVFENIRKNMLSWSEKKYIDFIMKNITSCINNEKDEIAIGKMHSKSLRKALEKYSKNKGLKFNLLEKDGDFEFGFIVNQKRIQKRFTIDDIIEEIRENKETMIVEEIFGKGS